MPLAPQGCPAVNGIVSFPTNTGIDVPVGEYEVYIDYFTELGSRRKVITIDLTN